MRQSKWRQIEQTRSSQFDILYALRSRIGFKMRLTASSSSVTTKDEIFIFGAGGHATSVASLARSCGFNVAGFIESTGLIKEFKGLPVLTEEIFENKKSINIVLILNRL